MKKLISVILMLALMLSLFQGISFAAEAETNIEAIEILQDISVMDKDITAKTYVTRADFIRMAVNIAKGGKALGIYEASPFNDVVNTHEDFSHIAYAHEYKIVSGDNLGNFNPDRPITYVEAVKTLVSMLGYDAIAKVKGGWPTGYIYAASNLKIDKGVDVTDDMLTPQAACILILNALECETMDISSIENGSVNFKTTGKTLLYTMMDIGIYEGILTENQFAGINIAGGTGANSVKIGNLGATAYTTRVEKYFGCNVRAYYRVDNGKNVVLSIYPSQDNKMWEIDSEDFAGFENNELSYYKNSTDRVEKLKVEGNVTVIYNGKNKDDYIPATFEIDAGIIRAIDNDSDGSVEVISVESYMSYPIASIDTNKPHIYGKYGSNYDVDNTSGDISAIFYDADGYEISLEELKIGDTLSLMVSEDEKYIRGIVSTSAVVGTVDSLRTDGYCTYAVISEKEYKLSSDMPLVKFEMIKLGVSGTFSIDSFGRIAYIEASTRNKDYGMVLGFSRGQGLSSVPQVKLMDVYGVKKIYDISKNCKLNEVSASVDVIEAALSVQNKMILYKLNNQQEISQIETADGSKLISLGDKATLAYRGNQRWFAGKLSLKTDTPVFVYPDGGSEDDYMVVDSTYLSEIDIEVQGFTTKAGSYAPEVVAVKKPSVSDSMNYNDYNLIISKISLSADPMGDVVTKIHGYTFSGNEIWYKLKDDSLIAGLDLKPGDFIKVKRDSLNYIIAVDKFYDGTAGRIYAGSKYATAGTLAGFMPYVGYVYEKSGDYIGFSTVAGASTIDDVRYYLVDNAKYLVLDTMRNGEPVVSVGSANDMQDWLNNSTETKVFFYSQSALVKTVIVFR